VSVRAVLFDAGHTLLAADYAALTAAVRACGRDVAERDVVDAERRARVRLETERDAQGSRARTGAGRYLRYLLEGLGVSNESEHAALSAWRRGFNLPIGLCCRADPDAVAALTRLRQAGLVTGVISNSNGSVALALERAGLMPYLDFVIDSTVVGIAKPDPRVFHLGLEAAKVSASEACYVGDSYPVDVRGARAVGMGAVLFDPGDAWGPRDCARAPALITAAGLALGARD
jgi:FMN phosphatase YigB (HAD superfamily)